MARGFGLEDGHDLRSGFWKRLDRRPESVIFRVKPKPWRGYLLALPLPSTLFQQVCTFKLELLCMYVVSERAGMVFWAAGRSYENKRTRLLITRHPTLAPLVLSACRPITCADNSSVVSIQLQRHISAECHLHHHPVSSRTAEGTVRPS